MWVCCFVFFKQKTAYEMRISDWSSDVCSSDLRLPETMDSALEEKSGYMKRSSIVAFAEAAGFKLAGESDVNANPRDTHNYPGGVWTLPPTLARKDEDRDIYLAIGESDRMTLKFVKDRKSTRLNSSH